MIRYDLQYYVNLLNSKQQLNYELKDVQNLLNKVNNSITRLQKSDLSKEEKEKLIQFESQKIELLTRLNEIAANFNSVNKEIASNSEEKIAEVRELISIVVELTKLDSEIKVAEKLSTKSNGLKVYVKNAEGKKRKIAIELVDDYIELIENKKKLVSKQRKIYEKFNNTPSLSVQKEVIEQVENPEQSNSNPKEVFKVEIDYFEKLPLEEKIAETKKRVDRIIKTGELPNQGKKMIINYNGKKYNIPKIYYGKFSETIGLLKKLEKEQAEKNKVQLTEEISPSQEITFDDVEAAKNQKTTATIIKKRKLIDIKKILKKHWKPIIAASLALTISATAFVASLSKKVDKQFSNYIDNQIAITNEIDVTEENDNKNIYQNNYDNKSQENNDNKNETENNLDDTDQEKNDSINIGNIVSLKENAPIYNNMYDATNLSNKLNQKYSGSSMNVLGVVFQVNDRLVFLTNENQIDEFNKMGYEITALALSLDGSNITGFYNINDVNVNTYKGDKTL